MGKTVTNTRRTVSNSGRFNTCAGLVFFLITALSPGSVCGSVFDCSADTYAQSSFEEPKRSFIPHDRIYLMIDCRNLRPGFYTMHVNWVHDSLGLVRTDSHEFTLDRPGDQTIFFWFKLLRRGPLTSAFTNQDFYERHFGEWTVDGYLNDQPVSSNRFSILD